MAKLDKKKLEAAAKFVQVSFDNLKKGQATRKNKIKKYWKMWKGEPVDRHYTGGLSNVVVNETHKAVESYVSNLKQLRRIVNPATTVVERRKFDNRPDNPQRTLEIHSLLEYQLDKSHFPTKEETAYRKLAVEGTVWFQVIWDMTRIKYSSQEPNIKEVAEYAAKDTQYGVPKAGAKANVTKEYELTPVEIDEVFDSPNVIVKRLENMYYDRTIEDFRKLPHLIELEEQVPLSKLLTKRGAGGKHLYSNLKELKEKAFEKASKEDQLKGVKIDLLHFEGKYDPDKNGIPQEYEIVVVKDLWICVLCRPNPYDHGTRSYRQVKFLPVDGSCDGLGIPELMYRQQVELNDNRNKMGDAITLALAQMKTVKRTANVNKNQLKPRPYGHIDVNQHDDVKNWEVDLRSVQMGTLLEKMMKEDYRTTTGALENIQGIGPGAETLGQSEMMFRQGMKKMFTILDRVENDFLKEIYCLYYLLSMQYRDAKWEILVLGKEAEGLKNIDKVRIFADPDFVPIGSKYIQQNYLQKQQDLTLLQIVAQFPRYTPVADELIKEIAKASGRGAEFIKAMQQAQQQFPVNEAAGGAGAQEAAGGTPQAGANSGLTGIKRSAGMPDRNQNSGGTTV